MLGQELIGSGLAPVASYILLSVLARHLDKPPSGMAEWRTVADAPPGRRAQAVENFSSHPEAPAWKCELVPVTRTPDDDTEATLMDGLRGGGGP
jgi:hypothetical protein